MEPVDVSLLQNVCIYLRKSRRDLELEQRGGEDTLARHRAILLADAHRWGLKISAIYEEVVTGDTIAERPRMTQLLHEIEAGRWDAVVCMDVDRLGRGGMRDQGILLDAFKWTSTLLLTHDRIYDLRRETDEEAMEYKAQGARFEYRMIKRRLARGREASVREGKFIGHTAPYGYVRAKLKKERGWTLEPQEPQAAVVRELFLRFADGESPASLAKHLSALALPSPGGTTWTPAAVRRILSNPEYCGLIRHGLRKTVKVFSGGALKQCRPRALPAQIALYPGRHPALISKEVFDAAAQRLQAQKPTPGPKPQGIANPLAGLVYCGLCGRAMIRRSYGGKRPDALLCPNSACPTVASYLHEVEALLLEGLRHWLGDLPLVPVPAEKSDALMRQRTALERERAAVAAQQIRACELAEQGIYSPELYRSRREVLERRAAALAARISVLEREAQGAPRFSPPPELPLLDVYGLADIAEEKNRLLKALLQKAVYHKTRSTRQKGGSDLTLTLYPRFPAR